MAKYRLDEPPDPELMLVGISSHVNDYRLCWSLNRQLGINLVRREKDIVEPGPRTTAHFAAFDHLDVDSNARYTLVNNHGEDAILLQEHRQSDFFLLVDRAAPIASTELLQQVRQSEFVLAAYPLEIQDLRAGHKLLQ